MFDMNTLSLVREYVQKEKCKVGHIVFYLFLNWTVDADLHHFNIILEPEDLFLHHDAHKRARFCTQL